MMRRRAVRKRKISSVPVTAPVVVKRTAKSIARSIVHGHTRPAMRVSHLLNILVVKNAVWEDVTHGQLHEAFQGLIDLLKIKFRESPGRDESAIVFGWGEALIMPMLHPKAENPEIETMDVLYKCWECIKDVIDEDEYSQARFIRRCELTYSFEDADDSGDTDSDVDL